MTQSSVTTVQHPAETTCAHHWIIESPSGPISKGTCRRCGAVREFRNYLDVSVYSNYGSRDAESDMRSALNLGSVDDDSDEG